MNENIEHFNRIVHDKSAGKVPGVGKVDLFTASMVKTVHDKLSPKNREKYTAMHPKKMIDVAYKLHKSLRHEAVEDSQDEHTVIHKPPHVPHDIARLHYDYQHVKRPKDRGLKPRHVDYKHVKRPRDRDLRRHNDYVIDDTNEQYLKYFGEDSEVDDTDNTPTDAKRRRAADQRRTHWDWKGINKAFSSTMDPRESVADDLLNMIAEGRSVVSVVDMIEGAAHDDVLGGDQPHERGRHDHEPHSGEGDYAPHPDIGLLTLHTNHPGAAQDASEMDPDSEASDDDEDDERDEEAMLRDAVLSEAGEMFGPAREKANKARAAANKQVMGLAKGRSKGDGEGEGKKITARKGFLGVGADPKTAKGQSKGYLTGINYMAPAGRGGTVNLCGDASPGCTRSCLHTAGNPAHMATKEKSRIAKNRRFMGDRRGFMKDMDASIHGAKKLAKKHGLKFAVRLNGTSDVGWEGQRSHGGKSPMEHHPDVQFYDYTKSQVRARKHREGKMPKNYHLTFSRDERPESHEFALDHVRKGGTAAVVFNVKKNGQLPKTWHGQKVIDGDKHDHRFLDKEEHGLAPHEGAWVGLRAKGDARHDTSGFVVHDHEQNP